VTEHAVPEPTPVEPALVDLRGDHHVHSTFSDDAVSSPAENLAAAQAAGLHEIRMVDHVRADTTYVPEFLSAVRGLPRRDGLSVLTGVEAKILDGAGHVDAPRAVLERVGEPDGVDRILLADHQFPGPDGPWSPRETRSRIAAGLAPSDAVDQLVRATVAAVRRVGRAQLAHPFSLLPKIGLGEDDVPDELLDELARCVVATGTTVEVNEKWRCPGGRVVSVLAAAGAALVASTDAHTAADVGRYEWLAAREAAHAAGGAGHGR
jgi:putative hydrolase